MYTVNQFIFNTNLDSMITVYQKNNSTFMNFYGVYDLVFFSLFDLNMLTENVLIT